MKKITFNNSSRRNCSLDYRYGIIKLWIERTGNYKNQSIQGCIYDGICKTELVPCYFTSSSIDDEIMCLSLLKDSAEYLDDLGISGLIVLPSKQVLDWFVSGEVTHTILHTYNENRNMQELNAAIEWFNKTGCNYLIARVFF